MCGVAKIKGQSFRREHVTEINWGELSNAFVHKFCLLLFVKSVTRNEPNNLDQDVSTQ